MPRYLLLLREDPRALRHLSPTELQSLVDRYRAWSASLGDALLDGEKLTDDRAAVVGRWEEGTPVTDGPFGDVKETVGGYFLVRADDLRAAVALCRDHPHLDLGSIELREVEELEP